MKPIRLLLSTALAFALAVFSTAARAETFQIVDDTAGSTKTNTIAKAAGVATTLPVSSKSAAFLRFNVSGSNIVSSAVTEARLVIYLPKVTKPGNLTLNVNDTGFTELFATKTIPSPTISSTVTAFAVAAADTKSFITIIVTDQVKAWIDGSLPENGFGIVSDGTASVLISSKEGSGSGYPAVLEVDATGTGGAVAGSDATFTGALSAASGSFTGTLSGGTGSFGGALNGTTATFSGGVSGTTGSFSGAVSGTTGTFSSTVSGVNGRFTGNVGIGTPNPGFPLEISSTGDTQFGLTSTSSGGRTYTFQSSNGGGVLGDGTFQIVDRTAVAARLVIDKTGNVGIGSYSLGFPSAKLQVLGDIKLGASGQLFATAGAEKLRIIRGTVNGSNLSIIVGSGFTVARQSGSPTGDYVVTFTTPFTSRSVVTASAYNGIALPAVSSDQNTCNITLVAPNTLQPLDANFNFIAVGGQ